VPSQIIVMSLALPSITVLADDARKKKRLKANNTSPYGKRMSSLSLCDKWPFLDS
jgi:hypothetical protein